MIDLQAKKITSKYILDAVGISGLRYHARIADEDAGHPIENSFSPQTAVTEWQLGVTLGSEERATHMSRFVDELHKFTAEPITLGRMSTLAESIRQRLQTGEASVRAAFTWFASMKAPVSQQNSLMSYDVEFSASSSENNEKKRLVGLQITVPVTALCPCSKAISERGAHNQRALVTVSMKWAPSSQKMSLSSLIEMINSSGSAPIYSLLKREDEKYVTEHAYDHPVFVEDLVRNVAEKISNQDGLRSFNVRAVDRESIHAHDCYAELSMYYDEKN